MIRYSVFFVSLLFMGLSGSEAKRDEYDTETNRLVEKIDDVMLRLGRLRKLLAGTSKCKHDRLLEEIRKHHEG